jgi:hypothetical protein
MSRELIPEGSPLDLTARDTSGDGEEGESDTEEADGDSTGADDVGYLEDRDADDTGDAEDSSLVLQSSDALGGSEDGGMVGQVADLAGMSEGSASMAAGIFIGDEPSEGEIEASPDTHAQILTTGGEEETREPKTASRARSKKKTE